MKKTCIYLVMFFFSLLSFSSCSDDNDGPRLTHEDGRPSLVKYDDGTEVSFYYEGKMISRIKGPGSFNTDFKYIEGELTSISSYPTDDRIADGNSYTTFKREGYKVTVKATGEPDFGLYVYEIELNENDIPVKITDDGVYVHGEEGLLKEHEGMYYALFTFDPETQILLKEELYKKENDERVATYTYEYDDSPGMMSKVDMPLWFYTYWNRGMYLVGSYRSIFFNYSGNLVKKVVDDNDGKIFKYEYNKAGYPVKMTIDGNDFLFSY